MNFPRWALVLMNAVVIAVLYGATQIFKLAGWQIALGFVAGYLCCYVLYGCWRVDDKNEGYRRFPAADRRGRMDHDRAVDPRV